MIPILRFIIPFLTSSVPDSSSSLMNLKINAWIQTLVWLEHCSCSADLMSTGLCNKYQGDLQGKLFSDSSCSLYEVAEVVHSACPGKAFQIDSKWPKWSRKETVPEHIDFFSEVLLYRNIRSLWSLRPGNSPIDLYISKRPLRDVPAQWPSSKAHTCTHQISSALYRPWCFNQDT